MMLRGLILTLSLVAIFGCEDRSKQGQAPEEPPSEPYAILIPDWRNDVVHEVGLDGTYTGDFLDPTRWDETSTIAKTAWRSPRGVLILTDRLWLIAERALSEWDLDGKFQRIVFEDSGLLEDPTGIVRIGDEVFVLSEDKKRFLVFDLEGNQIRRFGYPHLDRANDAILGPDGMLYVASNYSNAALTGLVSVWDPAETRVDAKPLKQLVPPDKTDDGTIAVHSILFESPDTILLSEFSRGRLERWNLGTNAREEILLDQPDWGAFRYLRLGPGDQVYLVGSDGMYRFPKGTTSDDLADLKPFFDASLADDTIEKEFSPGRFVFLQR